MEPATNDCKAAALLSRRHILARAGAGFGVVGLSGLLHSEGLLGAEARAAAGLGNEDWPRWLLSKLTFPVGPVR